MQLYRGRLSSVICVLERIAKVYRHRPVVLMHPLDGYFPAIKPLSFVPDSPQ